MVLNRYPAAVVAVAVAAVVALQVAPAGSQSTRPADEPRTTGPAEQIVQPAEFIKLAAKARKLEAVYAKGAGYVETLEKLEKPLPADMMKVDFEVWVVPPLAKTALATSQEVRVSDGEYVYALTSRPEALLQGRRRKITPGNFYHVLDMAAVYCDAAGGYQNLTRAVKFVPIAAPAKFAKRFPDLRWFQLQAATELVHHLVEGTQWVKMGLDPDDGLARVIVGAKLKQTEEAEGQPGRALQVEVSVVFDQIRQGGVKQVDLKLPAAGAKATWIDTDTSKPIPPPSHLIAAEQPKP